MNMKNPNCETIKRPVWDFEYTSDIDKQIATLLCINDIQDDKSISMEVKINRIYNTIELYRKHIFPVYQDVKKIPKPSKDVENLTLGDEVAATYKNTLEIKNYLQKMNIIISSIQDKLLK